MTTELDEIRQIVGRWAEVTAELTAPGQPFETVTTTIRGEEMVVFRTRPSSLREILADSAALGDKDCVIFDDGTKLTFAEFVQQTASVAAALADRGIGKGDRVAVSASNCAGWLLSFWATLSLGAVNVAMNGWWTGPEMVNALQVTEPKLLLGDTKRLSRLEGSAVGVPIVNFDVDFEDLRSFAPDAALPDVPLDEDDDAMLLFTSGTTGRPKAAVLTHRNILAYMQMTSFLGARAMKMAGRDASGAPPTRLAVFPLFHVSGLGATVSGIAAGATTVWPLGRFDPAHVIELTKQHGINGWGGTFTHVMRLLDEPSIATLDPLQMQQVGIGGSASSPELIRRTEERFPHLKGTFSTGYGSTESGALISYASNAMISLAPECVGPPLPTVEVRILDDDGTEMPEGEVGNIFARSPLVMREYWGNPEATAETLLPGQWLKTGDFGRIEVGALFLASRRRDLILRGGENVYPFEIENRIDELPDVTEVAVVGVDHPMLGQEVKAIVVVAEGSSLTPEGVVEWCRAALASYKVPADVEVRTAPLPRNASGKVMKHLLDEGGENIFEGE